MHSVYGETPFAMTSFLTNGCLCPNTIAAVIVAHQAAQQDCRAPCYVVQFGIDSNKEPGTFIEFASGSGPFFGLDCQSVRC